MQFIVESQVSSLQFLKTDGQDDFIDFSENVVAYLHLDVDNLLGERSDHKAFIKVNKFQVLW